MRLATGEVTLPFPAWAKSHGIDLTCLYGAEFGADAAGKLGTMVKMTIAEDERFKTDPVMARRPVKQTPMGRPRMLTDMRFPQNIRPDGETKAARKKRRRNFSYASPPPCRGSTSPHQYGGPRPMLFWPQDIWLGVSSSTFPRSLLTLFEHVEQATQAEQHLGFSTICG
jgi:hypothetical protein